MASFVLEKLKYIVFYFFVVLLSSIPIIHFYKNIKSYAFYNSDFHKILYGNNSLSFVIKAVNSIIGKNKVVAMRQAELIYMKPTPFHLYSQQIYEILNESSKNTEDLFNKFVENDFIYFLINDYNDPTLYSTKLYDLLNDPHLSQVVFNQVGWKIIKLNKNFNEQLVDNIKIKKIKLSLKKMFEEVLNQIDYSKKSFSLSNENENYYYSPNSYENYQLKQKGKYNYTYSIKVHSNRDYKLFSYYLSYNELGEIISSSKLNTFYIKKGINEIKDSFIKTEEPFRLMFASKTENNLDFNLKILSTKISDRLDFSKNINNQEPFVKIYNRSDDLWNNSNLDGVIFADETIEITNAKKIKLVVDGIGGVKVNFMPKNTSNKSIFDLFLEKIGLKKKKIITKKNQLFGINGKERTIIINNNLEHNVLIKLCVDYPKNIIIKKIEIE
ncbi:MAG: hypothetical protein Q8K37_00530 [Alphaproteobacteria bacterium]|nr:hypothetical protein [Alphaproteobacteria bacterium]